MLHLLQLTEAGGNSDAAAQGRAKVTGFPYEVKTQWPSFFFPAQLQPCCHCQIMLPQAGLPNYPILTKSQTTKQTKKALSI